MGRSHFSFGGERKVCKRKPAARRLREKALYCPFWRRGSLCRAQHRWTANIYVRARSCSLFSSFKKGKAFSLRCLSPLCSPAVGVGHTYPLQIENFLLLGRFWKITGQRVWRSEPRGLPPSGGLLLPTGRELHQTGEPWHLSCHGGNFTARPHIPRAPCAPKARSPGSRGSAPWERSSWKNEYAKCC